MTCSSNGLQCIAVGFGEFGGFGEPISYTSTDGGVTWAASTKQPPLDASRSGILSGVACSRNGLHCTAVGYAWIGELFFNNVPISYTSTDGGVTWAASTIQPSGDSSLQSVACSSNGLQCTAVGTDGFGALGAPISYTSTDGGVTWAASTTQPQGLGQISAVTMASQ